MLDNQRFNYLDHIAQLLRYPDIIKPNQMGTLETRMLGCVFYEEKRNIFVPNMYETLSIIKCLDHKIEIRPFSPSNMGFLVFIIITPQSKIDNHTVFIITSVLIHEYFWGILSHERNDPKWPKMTLWWNFCLKLLTIAFLTMRIIKIYLTWNSIKLILFNYLNIFYKYMRFYSKWYVWRFADNKLKHI